ncbi:ATP synthase F1 subunit gamma [Gorillibacterium massiliense]|uniref:ATP synthase F1 subunit gamma n=1 Tax=Gorillibacterium massiliense TaxID=1280390 RepID=UPI0004B01F61|nr:ATP synthase F1 subunit gamma [Gorillibacterium massiliense]
MAKGMREIKRQIRSVQNMKQITKAMEMVAASKLKKAQAAAEASRPYADKIREMVSDIAGDSTTKVNHPMLIKRPVKKTGYLVITSDRGLAGGFNANLLRATMQTIKERHASSDEYVLLVVGRKGRDYFRRRNMPVLEEVTGLTDSPTFADIRPITLAAVNNYANGSYDELYLIYNRFINAITQTPTQKQLLPLEEVGESKGAKSTAGYEYEPSAEKVLEVLLPKYAETLIYSAMVESKASEFGAKMTAMGSATKNATKLITSLTLQYNRARQATITQEITEIVAGANSQS